MSREEFVEGTITFGDEVQYRRAVCANEAFELLRQSLVYLAGDLRFEHNARIRALLRKVEGHDGFEEETDRDRDGGCRCV